MGPAGNLACDAVEVLLPDASDRAAAARRLLDDLGLLELLEDAPDEPRGSFLVTLALGPTAVLAAIPLAKRTDADSRLEVNLARDRRGANEEPVVL